ncbi:MAG: hypothetical protein OXH28_03830 [bacterium]|nr:hypothetical protein [bacterium]
MRAGGRAGLGRLVALVAAALALSALLASPALAHHFTGEVQLWASTVDFQDSPSGVLVTVRLIERESGESVSGFGVRVMATGGGERVGPVELQESEFAVYSGTLPLGPGQWEILVTTHQGTSSLPAIESSHRETLEIDAAGRVVVSGGGGSGATTTLAVVLPICALAVILLVVLRRRRLAMDGGADAGDDPAGDDLDVAATVEDPASDREGR